MPVFAVGSRIVPVFGRVWLIIAPTDMSPDRLAQTAKARRPPNDRKTRLAPDEFLKAAARRGLLGMDLPEDTPKEAVDWVQSLIFEAGDVALGSVASLGWATLYNTTAQTAAERYLQALHLPDAVGDLVICPEPCFDVEQILNKSTHTDVALLVVSYRPPTYNGSWTVLQLSESDEDWRVAYDANNVPIPLNQEYLFNV
jgi:hypothetical protein